MLPAGTLDQIRKAVLQTFSQSCDVLREGGVVARLDCAVVPEAAGSEQEEADRTIARSGWRVRMPVAADVRPTDTLRVFDLDARGRRTGTGTLYDVTDSNVGMSNRIETLVSVVRVV